MPPGRALHQKAAATIGDERGPQPFGRGVNLDELGKTVVTDIGHSGDRSSTNFIADRCSRPSDAFAKTARSPVETSKKSVRNLSKDRAILDGGWEWE
jgi:hypothetical protein